MFEKLSHIYTMWELNRKKLDLNHYDEIEISARGNIHGLITISVCLLISFWMGIFWESLLVLITTQIVRSTINGIHWDLNSCFFLTNIFTILSGLLGMWMTKQNINLFYIFSLLSIFLIKYLPFFDECELINEKEIRDKYINIVMILTGVCWISHSFGILWISNVISISIMLVVLTSRNWFIRRDNHE